MAIQNSENSPAPTVRAQSRQTQVAPAARDVDLADHALSDEILIRGLKNFPDELVPEHAAEAHVAFGDFEIGRADPRLADADDAFAIGLRLRVPRPKRK